MDRAVLDKGVYRFGPFVLDPVGRKLTRHGHPVRLTARPFDLLLYAVENAGRTIEKDELMSAVWGDRAIEEANLSQTISILRRVLRDAGGEDPFVTIPGRGYRIVAEVTRQAEGSLHQAGPVSLEQPCAGSDNDRLDLGVSLQRVWLARFPAATGRVAGWAGAGIAVIAIIAFALLMRGGQTSGLLEPAFDPPPKSLAVLAFTNMSSDHSGDDFADGMSEELIDTLGRGNALLVSAQTSAFTFKGSHATVGEIARKLNVGAVLEGVVRRSGGRVRVSVHFINARTGFAYWSGEYDRPDGDILQLESELAGKVAGSLGVTLLTSEEAQVEAGGTRDPRAQDAYLRGMALVRYIDRKSLHLAIAAFDEALRLDPGFANAHAGRCRALEELAAAFTPENSDEYHRLDYEALNEARHAVALAPGSALTHWAYMIMLETDFDLRTANVEAEKAYELGAGMSVVDIIYARAEAYFGHCTMAVAAAHRAIALDPLTSSIYFHAAVTYYFCRKYDESLAAADTEAKLGAADPARNAVTHALTHLAMGKPELALNDCRSTCRTTDWGFAVLAVAHTKLGQLKEAEADVAEAHKVFGNDPKLDAVINAQLGRRPQALSALQTAFNLKMFFLVFMKSEPMFDPIRDTPEFKDIERQMNFPP